MGLTRFGDNYLYLRHMERLYGIPAPADLRDMVSDLGSVVRFQGQDQHYPPGVVVDDSLWHTFRMAYTVKQLLTGKVAPSSLARALRTVFLHDLEETKDHGGFDLTLVEAHYNPARRRQKRLRERRFASRYLGPADRKLYRAYNRAKDYLRGESAAWPGDDDVALLVKVADDVDGLLVLHRALTDFAKSSPEKAKQLPSGDALAIGLKLNRRYLRQLLLHPTPLSIISITHLCRGMDSVRRLWEDLPPEYVMPEIKPFLRLP